MSNQTQPENSAIIGTPQQTRVLLIDDQRIIAEAVRCFRGAHQSDLVHLADKTLYDAKSRGRNRSVVTSHVQSIAQE